MTSVPSVCEQDEYVVKTIVRISAIIPSVMKDVIKHEKTAFAAMQQPFTCSV